MNHKQFASVQTSNAEVIHENGKIPSGKKTGFVSIPLSEEEKERFGLKRYYRPYKTCTEGNRRKKGYFLFKRVADIVLACIALIVFAPLMLVFMAAVVIEDHSAGPVFKQKRIGMNGKQFVMYKLRSMRKDAEAMQPALLNKNQAQTKAFKIKDDPRVTKIGKFARMSCVDELFQLINIIKGDMSIVGPRPPLPGEVQLYDEYELQRLSMKPGLTCIWQVYPGRHEVSFDDWVAMDLKYQNECGLFLDLSLILRTFMTIIRGHGD